jgi:hypothetical protein
VRPVKCWWPRGFPAHLTSPASAKDDDDDGDDDGDDDAAAAAT